MAYYYKVTRPLGVVTITQYNTDTDGYPAKKDMGTTVFLSFADVKEVADMWLGIKRESAERHLNELKAQMRRLRSLREGYFNDCPVFSVDEEEVEEEVTVDDIVVVDEEEGV